MEKNKTKEIEQPVLEKYEGWSLTTGSRFVVFTPKSDEEADDDDDEILISLLKSKLFLGERRGHNLGKSPVYCWATSREQKPFALAPYGMHGTCMSLDCGMKLKEPQREHPNPWGSNPWNFVAVKIKKSFKVKHLSSPKESTWRRGVTVLVLSLGCVVYKKLWLAISSSGSLLIAVCHFPPHRNRTWWVVLVANTLCKTNGSTVRRLFPLDGLGLPLLAAQCGG